MGNYKVKGVKHRRVKPKAVLTLLLLAVVAVVAWLQRDNIGAVVDALRHGAVLPLVGAFAAEGGRILFHAHAYTRSFRVIGYRVPLRDTVPAWFKAVFMNTVLPSGGTSGLAAVIDTARRRGVPVGSATTATIFTQTCFYLSMLFVIVVGFVVMARSGSLQVRDVLLGCIMGVAAFAFVGLLTMGHYAPGVLQRFLRWVERLVVRVLAKLRIKKQPKPWADNLVHSFSTAATEISRQPRRALAVLGSMVVAMAFDMCAFMCAGLAFGIDRPDALFGGYVTALVFNSFNVTPGGAGVVEGLASAVLVGYGYPLTVSVSAVLVYRALMYWIPLVVGGVAMYFTGAFGLGGAGAEGASEKFEKSEKDGAAAEPAARASVAAAAARMIVDDGLVYVKRRRPQTTLRERLAAFINDEMELRCVACALACAATGAVGLGAAVLPPDPVVVGAVESIAGGVHLLGVVPMAVFSYLLLVCVPGVLIHSQGNWLVAMMSLLGLGVSCALAGHSIWVMVLVIVSLALFAVWRGGFSFHGYFKSLTRLMRVLVWCVVVIVLFVAVGSLAVRGAIAPDPGAAGVVWMGFQTLLVNPSFDGVELGGNAVRFFVCARAVAVAFTLLMGVTILLVAVGKALAWRRPERREARAAARAEAEAADAERKEVRRAQRAERKAELRARLGLRPKEPERDEDVIESHDWDVLVDVDPAVAAGYSGYTYPQRDAEPEPEAEAGAGEEPAQESGLAPEPEFQPEGEPSAASQEETPSA